MGLNLRGIQWPVHESQLQAIISALQSNEVAHLGIKAEGLDKLEAEANKAIEMIQTIVTDFEEGQIFKGKVVSIKEFGAFIEFAPGKEGMVHISELSWSRIKHPSCNIHILRGNYHVIYGNTLHCG